MTLAAILLFSVFSTVPTRALGTAEVYPSAQTSSAPSTSNAQNTTGTATPQTSATPASSAVQQKPTATARPHHKKKVISGCPATPASATSASPGSSPSDPAAGSTPGHTSTATSAKTNCPPPKIVVRQGGTSEPPIQLGGGETGGQASAEKATANQMLGTARRKSEETRGARPQFDRTGDGHADPAVYGSVQGRSHSWRSGTGAELGVEGPDAFRRPAENTAVTPLLPSGATAIVAGRLTHESPASGVLASFPLCPRAVHFRQQILRHGLQRAGDIDGLG